MEAEAIVALLALGMAVACIVAGGYIWYVYERRNEDALFLTRLVHRDIRVSLASALIAAVIAWAYLFEPLPRPWGGIIIGTALIAMMLGPVDDALLWFRERRRIAGDVRQSGFNEPKK